MQFLVIAMDGNDDQALDRRMAARPDHFVRARKEYANGTLLMGGAIMDENDKMIGSSLYVDIETREALDQWLADDPYTQQNVWQTFDVKVMKLADLAS